MEDIRASPSALIWTYMWRSILDLTATRFSFRCRYAEPRLLGARIQTSLQYLTTDDFAPLSSIRDHRRRTYALSIITVWGRTMTRIALGSFEEQLDGCWVCRRRTLVEARFGPAFFVESGERFFPGTTFAGHDDFVGYLVSVSERRAPRYP
jgi:hypothetical protein